MDCKLGGKVHLSLNKCSCRKWQVSGLPCGHVIAVLRSRNFDDCTLYAKMYYQIATYRATYAELIYPLKTPQEWEVPDGLMTVRAPVMEARQPGRPRNNDRIPSQGEGRIVKKCSRCKQDGHTRTQCTAVLPSREDGSSTSRNRSTRGSTINVGV